MPSPHAGRYDQRINDGERIFDLRTYKTVPGRRDELVRIMVEGTVPMLRRYGITVVAYGPSIHDDDHAFLIRSFGSTAERDRQLEAFYGSDEWKSAYEDQVMKLIDSYHTVVTRAPLM